MTLKTATPLRYYTQEYFDNQEQALLYPPEGGNPYPLVTLTRDNIDYQEAARSKGMVLSDDVNFTIDIREAPAQRKIRPNWKIKDKDGNNYRVTHVTYSELVGCVSMTGRDLAVIFDLTNFIEIWRRVALQDGEGRNRAVWQKIAGPIKARLQPMDRAANEDLGIPQLSTSFTIYVEELPVTDLKVSDQIRTMDGRILEPKGVENQDAIDTVPQITADDNGARWKAA